MSAELGAFAAFDEFEAAGWARKDAGAYDALLGRVTARVADPLLEAVGARAGTRLLDVGTGPGYVAVRAAERGAEAVGVDFSPSLVAFARSRAPGVEFVVGDARDLPFADASFDAVVAAFLLLHLGTPEAAVREAARVVRRDGRVAFSVWDVPAHGPWLAVLFDAIAAAGASAPAELPPAPHMFTFADDDAFTSLLRGAGLVDVCVEDVAFPLEVASADELWQGLVDGTVRTGPLVRAQPPDVQAAIRRGFDGRLEEHRTHEGYSVGVAVKVAAGARP